MAKKTIDWETVAKDREVLARVEDMVKEGGCYRRCASEGNVRRTECTYGK